MITRNISTFKLAFKQYDFLQIQINYNIYKLCYTYSNIQLQNNNLEDKEDKTIKTSKPAETFQLINLDKRPINQKRINYQISESKDLNQLIKISEKYFNNMNFINLSTLLQKIHWNYIIQYQNDSNREKLHNLLQITIKNLIQKGLLRINEANEDNSRAVASILTSIGNIYEKNPQITQEIPMLPDIVRVLLKTSEKLIPTMNDLERSLTASALCQLNFQTISQNFWLVIYQNMVISANPQTEIYNWCVLLRSLIFSKSFDEQSQGPSNIQNPSQKQFLAIIKKINQIIYGQLEGMNKLNSKLLIQDFTQMIFIYSQLDKNMIDIKELLKTMELLFVGLQIRANELNNVQVGIIYNCLTNLMMQNEQAKIYILEKDNIFFLPFQSVVNRALDQDDIDFRILAYISRGLIHFKSEHLLQQFYNAIQIRFQQYLIIERQNQQQISQAQNQDQDIALTEQQPLQQKSLFLQKKETIVTNQIINSQNMNTENFTSLFVCLCQDLTRYATSSIYIDSEDIIVRLSQTPQNFNSQTLQNLIQSFNKIYVRHKPLEKTKEFMEKELLQSLKQYELKDLQFFLSVGELVLSSKTKSFIILEIIKKTDISTISIFEIRQIFIDFLVHYHDENSRQYSEFLTNFTPLIDRVQLIIQNEYPNLSDKQKFLENLIRTCFCIDILFPNNPKLINLVTFLQNHQFDFQKGSFIESVQQQNDDLIKKY